MYYQPPSSALSNNLTQTFTETLYKSCISLRYSNFLCFKAEQVSIFYKDYSDYCCHSADEVQADQSHNKYVYDSWPRLLILVYL